jgi:hypothetical protein
MTRSWGEWASWVAVVPMRTQPLHLAHVNLVANLAERFAAVRVVVGNQPRSIDDPYTLAQRLRWWRESAEIHHLDGVKFVRGAHGCPDDERVHRYVAELPVSHVAIVSGNHEVAEFWSDRRFAVLDSCRLPLRDLVSGDTELRRTDSLGRRLRAALGRGHGDRLVRPLVPPWVWDDLRRTS